MARLRSLAILLLTVAASAFAADDLSLINSEAMETYRSAVSELERNPAKGRAMLNGLLVSSLTVGIDSDIAGFRQGARDAIASWNRALNQDPFRLVGPGVKADIVVRFVSMVNGGHHAQGMVRAKRHFRWDKDFSQATIVGAIEVRDNVDGRAMRQDEVARVVAHELGHLLGLDDDHDSDGIMGDFLPGSRSWNPTGQELAAVLDFRALVEKTLARS